MKNKRILAVGAHPDDVEIGCGGLLLTEIANGAHVLIVDITQGEMGTNGNSKIRMSEAQAACEKMGASRINLEIQDRNITTDFTNRIKLAREIRKFKPDVVIYPYGKDRHPDHEDANRLVRQSIFDAGILKISIDDIPHHKVMRQVEYYINDIEDVTNIFDISKQMENKMELLKCHESQFIKNENSINTSLNQGYLNMLKVRGEYFGSLIGCEYGEPLHIMGIGKVDSI